MSDLKAWINERRPASPVELGPWIDASGVTAVSALGLTNIACDALEQARLSPGRVRNSAFQLLTADALITYACESALDGEDPDLVLRVIMQHSADSS